MIYDPEMVIECDKCNQQTVIFSPNYVYTDYSGDNGHYDFSDNAVDKCIEQEGWKTDGDEHHCSDCCTD